MIKSKKQMYLVIGAFALVLMLGTVTYAFFNYTRTGSANTIRTGRIAFNSQQGNSINLTNVFPVDVSNGIPNNNPNVGSVTINVTGDTTYGEGVEYLVSAVNVQNTIGSGANAKNLPISIDVSVASNTNNDPATTLGTADSDYFTNRGSSASTSIYKVLASDVIANNDQLVVGYIKSGATGVDGNIVIRAYLDASKIAISDTYPEETVHTVNTTGYSSNACETALTGVQDASTYCTTASSLQDAIDNEDLTSAQITLLVNAGIVEEYTNGTTSTWVGERTVFTTSEWNSLQANGVSFQVKVESNEGIWVEEPKTLYNTMKKLSQGTISDFSKVSSEDGTSGVYETSEGITPIYYYRGAVSNNVIFGDFCWKAVRTTTTGGVKLIYNGEVVDGKCTTQTGNGTVINNGTTYAFNDNDLYAGYVYSTNNTMNDSKIKEVVDNWYDGAVSNSKINDSKIETTFYCSDQSTPSIDNNVYHHGAFDRLSIESPSPSLNCSNSSDNISLKVGLITADEVAYAGGKQYNNPDGVNTTYYLYNNINWWTMSPCVSAPYVHEMNYYVRDNGGLSNSSVRQYSYGVRPVISIIPGALISSGDGTTNNPYVIS